MSQGVIKTFKPGDTAFTTPTNTTGEEPPLVYSGLIQSTCLNQLMFFADGTNWVYFNPHTSEVLEWRAEAGELPVDEEDNAPRLICTWRGRIVLSGILLDQANWFMSAVGNPFDFDYAGETIDGQLSITPTMAVAGDSAPCGLIGDLVTTLIPFSDDILITGCDSSIYMMRGDPADGGQIDLVTKSIGMAWGLPWCQDPFGNIYFFSNKMGIYVFVPGQQPQRISQQIEPLIKDVDSGNNAISMIWDDKFQGLNIWVTPLDEPQECVHLFYEQRNGSWFTQTFADNNMNPLCCCTFDGNLPGDRVALLGSFDGYIRFLDPNATKDDHVPIQSEVVIGPILTDDGEDVLVKDLIAVMGETSNDVTYEIYTGTTAEEALASDPIQTGTFTAGRNFPAFIRRSGHALYVRISGTMPWAMESLMARLQAQGKVRQRTNR